ncbi:MAG: SUMF1/EgtB/PvdO family nonheme iron enzyme [Chitinophagales bacterium]|nr:SUMF1/EgtB/PvdO family nonheme iron enzyme [Chitinophagales bacterium]
MQDTIINEFAFVRVDSGAFTYGFDNQTRNLPYAYFIMKYEVTCAQYYQFLKAQLHKGDVWIEGKYVMKNLKGYLAVKDSVRFIKILDAAIYRSGDTLALNPFFAQHPVTQVNWFGCMEFCRYYELNLPTRHEWEKAARGNTGWVFPWGNNIDSSRANYRGSKHPFQFGTTPVGFFNGQNFKGFQTNNSPSPYGCYDMAGNAYEYTVEYWCKVTGGGGGYHYHTAGMVAAPFQNCYGLPIPAHTGICDTADGFRAVYKPNFQP